MYAIRSYYAAGISEIVTENMANAAREKYLDAAYEAMWGRVGQKLSKEETAALRAKLYK